MLAEDVPRLMSMLPREEHNYLRLTSQSGENYGTAPPAPTTIFHDQQETPFAIDGVEGINAGMGEYDWIVERSRHEYDQVFAQLSPQNGKISGASAKQEMIKSKLVKFLFKKNKRNNFFKIPSQIMYLVVYGN
jgi:EH domain-containing protein 1